MTPFDGAKNTENYTLYTRHCFVDMDLKTRF